MANRHRDVLQGNTGQSLAYENQAPAYAATISSTFTTYETCVIPAKLTGDVTMDAVVTDMKAGDRVIYVFESDASIRTVTFGSNHLSAGTLATLAADGKTASAVFIFNGTNLVEVSRAIEA